MTDPTEVDSSGFGELRWVESCDSTNDLVRSMVAGLPAKASPRAVACADEQRAGRGRLDRRWEARPGAALMLSVAHEAPSSPELLGALPLAMGLAALEAIADVLDGAEVEARLKWPNDLMVAGGGTPGAERGWLKAGGILGESFDDPRRGAATGRVAVLGIGINTAWPGPRADLPEATSLNLLTGREVDRRLLAGSLLARYRRWWRRLLDGDRDGFRATLEARSATLGRRVRVELPASELVGVADSITAAGVLVVLDDAGDRHEVTVGDVVHLRAG